MHFLKTFSGSLSFLSLKNFSRLAHIGSEIFGLKKRLQQKGKVNQIIVNVTMDYNQKINKVTIKKSTLVNMIEKSFLLHHINMTIMHKNLISLKQEFSHI